MHWRDRKEIRKNLNEWINSTDQISSLVFDKVEEIGAIKSWFDSKLPQSVISCYIHSNESRPTDPFDLLEQLIDVIGKEHFKEFYKWDKVMAKSANPFSDTEITQQIGCGNNSVSGTEAKDNSNVVNLIGFDLEESKHKLRNRAIIGYLRKFLEEFQAYRDSVKTEPIVLITVDCDDYDSDPAFFGWLTNTFIPKLIKVSKTCVIHRNGFILPSLVNEKWRSTLNEVNVNDVKEVLAEELSRNDEAYIEGVCDGIMEGKSSIPYTVFSTKLTHLL